MNKMLKGTSLATAEKKGNGDDYESEINKEDIEKLLYEIDRLKAEADL